MKTIGNADGGVDDLQYNAVQYNCSQQYSSHCVQQLRDVGRVGRKDKKRYKQASTG